MNRAVLVVLGLSVPLLAAVRVCAADPLVVSNTASLAGSTLADGKGIAAINEAAGNGNLQANSDAITSGAHAGAGIRQQLSAQAGGDAASSARIAGDAFARFSGILSVNQAAGSDNLEANSVTITRSVQRLSLDQLTHIASPIHQINRALVNAQPKGQRDVVVADNALKGVTGIAQVSQTAGSGNSLSNSVTLSISAGIHP
ncbi:MAG: hypothetical protein ACYCTF_06680 [Acidiferrobacter sp.]